jgi:phosphatidylserine decarboxylase
MSGRLFVAMQYLLPKHAISRLIWHATRARTPWFKNALIRGFMRLYDIDMSEAAESDPLRYGSFNEFFTRELRSGARQSALDPTAIVCPVDGRLSECGAIDGERLLQAKGQYYTVAELLADASAAQRFRGGQFATIYLAPFNYHRIHMPLAGQLRACTYVPGSLFSVNAVTARHVPQLFARNERVVCLFDTPAGSLALVLVGALNVGSMSTVWAGDVTPAPARRITRLPAAQVSLARGAEMGRFNMGSSVILLFEPGRVAMDGALAAGLPVQLGQTLGTLVQRA